MKFLFKWDILHTLLLISHFLVQIDGVRYLSEQCDGYYTDGSLDKPCGMCRICRRRWRKEDSTIENKCETLLYFWGSETQFPFSAVSTGFGTYCTTRTTCRKCKCENARKGKNNKPVCVEMFDACKCACGESRYGQQCEYEIPPGLTGQSFADVQNIIYTPFVYSSEFVNIVVYFYSKGLNLSVEIRTERELLVYDDEGCKRAIIGATELCFNWFEPAGVGNYLKECEGGSTYGGQVIDEVCAIEINIAFPRVRAHPWNEKQFIRDFHNNPEIQNKPIIGKDEKILVKIYNNIAELKENNIMFTSELGLVVFYVGKTTYEKCPPVVTIHKYSTTMFNVSVFPRRNELTLSCSVVLNDSPDCKNNGNVDVVINWYMWLVNNNHDEKRDPTLEQKLQTTSLVLPPYSLNFGVYKVKAEVKVISEQLNSETTYSYFKIIPLPLQPIIVGGTVRYVYFKDHLELITQEIIDHDYPLDNQPVMGYVWTCNDTDRVCKERITKDVSLTINGPFVAGKVYNFTMKISSHSKMYAEFTNQIVVIYADPIPSLLIVCMKNCGGKDFKTDIQEILYFKVIHSKYSAIFSENNSYEWSCTKDDNSVIAMESIRQEDETPSWVLVIDYDKLEHDALYIFKVMGPNKDQGLATFAIKTFRDFDAFTCEINPKNGISGETKFYISCLVTNQEAGLYSYRFSFYDMSSKTDLLGRLVGTSFVEFIGDIVLTRGTVAVYATNTFGQYHKTYVSATLTLPHIDSNFVKDKIEALGEISQGEGHEQKISFISSICDILNSNPAVKASAVERLLEIIKKEKATDIYQLELILSVTQSVICAENDCKMSKMTTNSFKYLTEIFLEVAKKFTSELKRTSQLSTELTSQKVDIFYTQLLKCAGILLTFQDDKLANKSYEIIDFAVYDLFKYSNLKIMGFLQQMQMGLALKTLPFVKHHAIRTEYVETWLKEDNPQYFTKGTKGKNGGSFIRMSPNLANYFLGKFNSIVVHILQFNKDPYWWSQNSDIMTDVISVHIGYKMNNQKYVPVNRFFHPIDIFLRKSFVNVTMVSGQVMQPQLNYDFHDIDMNVSIHKVFATKGSTISLKFVNITYSLRVKVMINRRPNYHDVMTGQTITEETPSYHSRNVIKEEDDVGYIGILPGEEVAHGEWLHYTFELQSPRCQVWRNVLWETTGCSLGLESTEELLHCQCDHLSSVAGFLGVPVNTVDPFTDYKLFLTLPQNPFVFAFVIIIIIVYVLLLIHSYKSDKYNCTKLEVIILKDNISSDRFGYLITVFTGSRWFAGTTSNIGIILHGMDYSCPAHILKSPTRSTLNRGSDDWFILFTPNYLGKITSIQMWSDHSGEKPNWFCDRIHIHDLTCKEDYTFLLGKWFGINQFGMDLETFNRPVELSKELYQLDFFLINLTFGFKEKHLWISMFAHHPRSHELRTQRVSMAMVALIIMLLTSVMFYDATFPEDVDVSAYELNRREFIISVISIAMSASAALVVYLGFRMSYSIKKENPQVSRQLALRKTASESRLHTDSVHTIRVSKQTKRDFCYYFKKFILCLRNKKFVPIQAKTGPSSVIVIHKNRLILAWGLCFTIIFIASFFIVLYGLKFGKVKSLLWLTSIGLSLGGDIFLKDPLKIVLLSFLFGLVQTQMYDVFSYDPYIYKLRKDSVQYNFKEDQCILKNRLQDHYKPLRSRKIQKVMLQQLKVIKWWQFIDILSICFSVLLSFLLIALTLVGEHEIGGILQNPMLKNIGVGEYYVTAPITNVSSYYQFLQISVLPTLYSTQWYNKQPIHDSTELLPENGWTADGSHRMMGIPRLRQIRIQQRECEVPSILSDLSFYCNVLYSPSTEDTDDYGTQWKGFTWDDIMFNKSIWNYVDPEESSSIFLYADSQQVFHGGGYIVDLSRCRRESSNKLWNLDNAGWLDIRTRVVFFEVTTYNVNKNVFTIINFIVEHLGTGSALSANRIWTVHIISYYTIFNLVYSFYIILDLIRLTMIMNTVGVRVFTRTFWNAYDFILIVIGFVYIVSYVVFSEIMSHYIDEFQQTGKYTFFHIQNLIFSLLVQRYLMGLMLCMTIVRLLRLLNYGVEIISDKQKCTLYYSWPQIFGLTFVFISFSLILQRPIAYFMNSFYPFRESHLMLFWMDYSYLAEVLNQSEKTYLVFLSCYFSYILGAFYVMILIKNYQLSRNVYLRKALLQSYKSSFMKRPLSYVKR